MKRLLQWILTAGLWFSAIQAYACALPASICDTKTSESFALIDDKRPVPIVIDGSADTAVQIAAENFSQDLQRVSGKRAKLYVSPKTLKSEFVLIAELGNSALLDGLVSANLLDVSDIEGQWEAYKIAVIDNPWPNVDRALVIAGSDRRGAVFGTYDLSERIGVSPWYWFADVPVAKQQNVFISAGERRDQPKVKYRGIFINDEDPALKGWATKKFGGVNSKMYQHVFELVLRLKGNYLWPAMWGKAFHLDDPRNTSLADEMGMVMGTSHHEPMTRAHAEWHRYPDDPTTGGAWNYVSNAENLKRFWRGGIERMTSKGKGEAYESLVTVGMRGDGDEPMSEGTAIKLLETVVADQRKIIEEVTGKPAKETPQVWALYKEVQAYYDQGMKVPDDVMLLFADDNWGQVRRLPTKDVNRPGGYGVYYHFDYVGAPRNYKWQNTKQIAKVWQQMNLSYERGAKNLWVVNVGDIKPVEYPISFFLKMAWNPERMTPEALQAFPKEWAALTFGDALSEDIGELISRYSQYAARRKPELIDSKTWPLGEVTKTTLDGGEFGLYVSQWRDLVRAMERVKAQITADQSSAFYQHVEFPILSMSNLYELYYATAWNQLLASRHDKRANHFLEIVQRTFARDAELTNFYHSINNGKWDGMLNQVHMNYVHWNDPIQQTIPSITRVGGDSIEKAGVKFVSAEKSSDIIEIDASDFDRSHAAAGLSWIKVPELGQGKAAAIAYPQGRPETSVKDNVSLEYDFDTSRDADLSIAIELSPSLDTKGSEGIRLAVSLNDGPVQTLKFYLEPTGGAARTQGNKDWYAAVKNNRHTLKAEFEDVEKGKNTLKLWRIDDNVILEKITIDQD